MPCKQCGLCCKNLDIQDMVLISLSIRSFMPKKKCRFQLENNKCSIYHRRPKLCQKWESCYVFNKEVDR